MASPLLKEKIVVTSDCENEVENEIKEKITKTLKTVIDQCVSEYYRSIKASIQIEIS